ncbi:MAG: ABC transporter substrate-binding protein [Chloroflexi bacterium]|nr:ABC transporter substrate-binding protein [Chloroflexota bacterium]
MHQPARLRAARPFAALAMAAALLLPSAAPVVAADPLILRVGTDQKLETLNPWHAVTVADYEIFQIQYDLLVSFGQDLQPAPGFADTWESSPDAMTHTFHIREGMKWSDGEPATCEDARWTYQFVLDVVASETGYVGSGYLEPYLTNTGAKTVACTDANTLVVETEFPTTLLEQAYIPILPKHIWSKYTQDQIGDAEADGFFVNEPPVVGTGPYVAVEWEPGQFIRMARNPSYWGKAGAPDELIFQTFAGSDTMVAALKAGEVDYIRGISADLWDGLAGQPDIQTVEGFSNGYSYLSYNTKGNSKGYSGSTSALSDVAFRDALGYAIDREKLVDATLAGHGVPGDSQVPPYHANWYVKPATPRYFDLAEANRRLDAAGYTRNADGNRVDKDGKVINLRLTWPDSEEEMATNAQFIQGWFKDLGISVDAYVTEEGKLLSDLVGPGLEGTANWDFYMWGWVGDPDPMSLLSFFTSFQIDNLNDSFYADARYDELFGLQQRATDEAERFALIKEMQEIFYRDSPYDVLYYDNVLDAYRTDKFANWTNQPPEGGTPIFGYGYPGYLALTDAAAATPAPSVAAPTAAPSGSAPEPTPAASADGGSASSSDNTPLILGGVVLVVVVVVGALVLSRRKSSAPEEDE